MQRQLPPSVTSYFVNALACAGFFVMLYGLREYSDKFDDQLSLITITLLCLATTFVIIFADDMFRRKVYRFPSTFLDFSRPTTEHTARVAIKYIGLLGTFGFVGFFYWIFPEYHGSFYNYYYSVLEYALILMVILGLPYFYFIDRYMVHPEDGYWHLGLVITGLFSGGWREADRKKIAELFRVWIVKGFFLPLMFTYIVQNVNFLYGFSFASIQDFKGFFNVTNSIIYTIDVLFAALGYVVTMRFLDSHIRSVEPTMLGWIVCIMCYEPFWSTVFYGYYFAYNDNIYWQQFTAGSPMLEYVWGMTILLLTLVYSLATVSLGYRFSNLTYRGLVTNGPYRFSKHPAYICKNLSWWLISVPFIVGDDAGLAIRQCFLLLGVNAIYFLRARTEERHLSHYPEFVEYAKWMNEHGLLAWLGKAIPFFAYDEARAKEKHPLILEPR